MEGTTLYLDHTEGFLFQLSNTVLEDQQLVSTTEPWSQIIDEMCGSCVWRS